ncbi:GDSL esterase/lipase [Senna tora]|uniref:GDSL esterase/lipase n=1 Tax=Senna tora TaxID=362788 RepID=A0A834TZ42_9FABA|nr:GDSL esterase/lipase [Senna tora]
MISETDIFNLSGPSYIDAVDWSKEEQRRCVLASVVQGVYILEHDRQLNRVGPKSLSTAWWESFHFHLVDILVDNADHTMFGAILHLNLPKHIPSSPHAPKYVVAFRGTLTGSTTRSRDLLLDLKCILNTLHQSSRFQLALRSIRNAVSKSGSPNHVWLAGHSLGSAIALLAGKHMAKSGQNLPTYLFNSPFTSAPLERIKHEKVKQGIHIASSVLKAGLSSALTKARGSSASSTRDGVEDGLFDALKGWVPRLFVNPNDHICSGYIGYFAQREKMEKIGAGRFEKVATRHTVESLVSGALERKSEPLHLLPSAELVINETQTSNFRAAHGLEQWWDPLLRSRSILYRYN